MPTWRMANGEPRQRLSIRFPTAPRSGIASTLAHARQMKGSGQPSLMREHDNSELLTAYLSSTTAQHFVLA